jgi:hypothetical protein
LSVWLESAKRAFSQQPTRPKLVFLIRHGEKTGKKNDTHLNARGEERANALPGLFPAVFPAPDFIFATKATANSNRPVETVMPLAKALGLTVQAAFANDEALLLARELLASGRYAGKTLLICWHKGKIPALATALGVAGKLPEWTEQHYDRIWRLHYPPCGNVVFANLPQRLLPGDAEV